MKDDEFENFCTCPVIYTIFPRTKFGNYYLFKTDRVNYKGQLTTGYDTTSKPV